MKHPSRDRDELVRLIYQTTIDPGSWPAVLEGVARLVGVERAMMFIADMPSHHVSVELTHEMDPDVVTRWRTEFVDKDLWSLAMAPLGAGFLATGASVVDFDELSRGPFYCELVGPAGGKDVLTTSLGKDGPIHSALSLYGRDFFSQRQVEALRGIAPDLQLAVRLQRQIGALRARAEAAEMALDSLPLGVITLDACGRIIHANRAAEVILARRDGFAVEKGHLRCARERDRRSFDAAVAEAAAGALGRGEAKGAALAVSRPSCLRPLGVIVAPVFSRDEKAPLLTGGLRHRAAVLVTISDPDAAFDVSAERLVRIFGLTPAESRLAVALAAGDSLADYAARIGITIGTARWTLRQVLEKTGCRRQSELVSLIVRSAAGVGGGQSPDSPPLQFGR